MPRMILPPRRRGNPINAWRGVVDDRQRLELVIGRRARQRPLERRRAFAPRIGRAFLPAISDQAMFTKKKTIPRPMIM
jgi:hypothetical protein